MPLIFAFILGAAATFLAGSMLNKALRETEVARAGEDLGREASKTYSNPVSHDHTADPDVMLAGDRYVVASTSNRAEDFARGGFVFKTSPATGPDALVKWESAGHVFPVGAWPAWVNAAWPDFWAPAWGRKGVAELFGVARHKDGDLAIFYAQSDKVLGPYSTPAEPFLRGPIIDGKRVGVIDPHYFEWDDNGKKRGILYYKIDGNDPKANVPTDIYAQEVELSGPVPRLVGERKLVMTNDAGEHVIEAPYVVKHGDEFVMIASKDAYLDPSYSLVTVKSKTPFDFSGPKKVILASGGKFKAPGHHTIVEHEGKTMILFHAFDDGAVGWDQARKLHMMPLGWDADGLPVIGDGKPAEGALERPGSTRAVERAPRSEGFLRILDRTRERAQAEKVR